MSCGFGCRHGGGLWSQAIEPDTVSSAPLRRGKSIRQVLGQFRCGPGAGTHVARDLVGEGIDDVERLFTKPAQDQCSRKSITCADRIHNDGRNRRAVGPFARLKEQAARRTACQGNQLQTEHLREGLNLVPDGTGQAKQLRQDRQLVVVQLEHVGQAE